MERGVGMTVPFLYSGKEIGQLVITAAGERTQIEATVPRDDSGLFRGTLCCRRGEIPLGILEPQGRYLVLRRLLLSEEIHALGGAVSGEMRLSYAFHQTQWQPLGDAPFFTKPLFRGRIDRKGDILWRTDGRLRFLAFPFQINHPFPMPELFCFARILTIHHLNYAVYAFNDQDFPVMITKKENPGKNENASTTSCTFML